MSEKTEEYEEITPEDEANWLGYSIAHVGWTKEAMLTRSEVSDMSPAEQAAAIAGWNEYQRDQGCISALGT